MTATTKVHPRKEVHEGRGFTVFSMDDPMYGELVHTYAPADAVQDDILSNFRVVVPVVTDAEVAASLNDEHSVSLAEVASYVGMSKAIKQYGCTHSFAFTKTVSQARRFAGEIEDVVDFRDVHREKIDTFAVWGNLQGWALDERLSAFEASPNAIISNPKSLIEGVDIPDVDCVAFLSPRRSELTIAQAIGRLLRKKGDKVGTVVCPLYAPDNQVRSDHIDAIIAVVEQIQTSAEALTVQAGQVSPQDTSHSVQIEYLAPPDFPLRKLRRSVMLREIHRGLLKLTDEMYRNALLAFVADHGRVPTSRDGDAEPYLGLPLTWKSLVERSRRDGLPWKQRLEAEGLIEVRQLTEAAIVEAAKLFAVETGKMPRMDSGDATKHFGFKIAWVNIERALQRGHLGLAGGKSLSKLLREHKLRGARTKLTVTKISRGCIEFHQEHGHWPIKTTSGDASKYIGEHSGSTSWNAVDVALSEGWRGLSGGTTLRQLCETLEEP